MMQRRFVVRVVVLILISLFLINIEGFCQVHLTYRPVLERLQYQTEITQENIVDLGKTHVSSKLTIGGYLDNELSGSEIEIMAKTTFREMELKDYQRKLYVVDSTSSTELNDSADIAAELENQVNHRWVNLVLTNGGEIAERYGSADMDNLKYFDMKRLPENLFIPMPKEEVVVGEQWQASKTSSDLPYELGKTLTGQVTYTYLGQEEYLGVACNKIRAVLNVDEILRGNNGRPNVTQISWVRLETLYFAVDGGYLVSADISNDLSLLVVVDMEEGTDYRNFIHNRIDYKIRLMRESDKQDN